MSWFFRIEIVGAELARHSQAARSGGVRTANREPCGVAGVREAAPALAADVMVFDDAPPAADAGKRGAPVTTAANGARAADRADHDGVFSP
jgi:hypothetical protein